MSVVQIRCPEELDPWPRMSPRTSDIVRSARALLEQTGWDAVTMRDVAGSLGIKAPSLYKHVSGKPSLAGALTAVGMAEMGEALHTAVAGGGGVPGLLSAYRRTAHGSPHLYRLSTTGELARDLLPPGLEGWAGSPFLAATGDPYVAQALWSTVHGMVILELDRRYPSGNAPDETWARAAEAFG